MQPVRDQMLPETRRRGEIQLLSATIIHHSPRSSRSPPIAAWLMKGLCGSPPPPPNHAMRFSVSVFSAWEGSPQGFDRDSRPIKPIYAVGKCPTNKRTMPMY